MSNLYAGWLKSQILRAAKADSVPAGKSDRWIVRKFSTPHWYRNVRCEDQFHDVPPGAYTQLFYRSLSGIAANGIGDLVMHDQPHELKKHLQFLLTAHGHVLITGLGLGCVTRGCLANPAVKHVTVVENSPDVVSLVWPHMPDKDRMTLIKADALTWTGATRCEFDCAWHDLFSDTSAGDDHLQVKHMELICNMAGRVALQGAWELPRDLRRQLKTYGVI